MAQKSYLIAAGVAAITVLWLASGQFKGNATQHDPKADLTETSARKNAARTAVRVRIVTAQARRSEIILRGRTQSVRRVDLKSELDSRVVALPVRKGETVTKGQAICRLDIQDRAARRTESQAILKQRELEFKAATALSRKGYRAETQLAASRANLDSARAALKHMEVEVAKTVIRAPFDGIIDQRPAEIGYYLQKGHVCATIIDQDPFLVVGFLSERNVGLLKVGDRGTAHLITGQDLEGTIRFISTAAEETTRTFRLELEVANPDHTLRDGVTAEIKIPATAVQAHLIAPSLLTLDDAGVMGVKIVDQDGIVRFRELTMIDDVDGGIWVSGLPETVTLITVGHEFVRDGQKVTVVDSAGGA